jgi:hypothetical protein
LEAYFGENCRAKGVDTEGSLRGRRGQRPSLKDRRWEGRGVDERAMEEMKKNRMLHGLGESM